MFIGALIDAGADPVHLREELNKLHIEDEYELKWKKVVKNGITCTKFDVILQADLHHPLHHDHTHEKEQNKDGSLHTHEHAHTLEHHEHGHIHEHDHTHEGHGHVHTHAGHHHLHHHDHRSYKDIVRLIEAAGFSEQVKNTALQVFRKIGEAEGRIHGVPLEQVHFHEVGAVDSIIDIVGAAILIHQLGIDTVKSSPIPVGKGKIRIDHGIYPVPAPATLEMLRGVPIEQSDIRGELTTPTGAAFIAVLAEEFGSIPSMKIQTIGYGAGTKTFPDHPNVLRVIIGE